MGNQYQSKISTIRTDIGGEFFSQRVDKGFLRECVLRHEHIVHYNGHHNGVVEQKNQALLYASCGMLHVASLNNWFWQEVIAIACYHQNKSPHKTLGLHTPYPMWFATPSCIWRHCILSYPQIVKPFLNGLAGWLVWFSTCLSFLNQFELGLGWFKPNRFVLG